MDNQCQCITKKGNRCKLQSSKDPNDDNRFCKKHHQQCTNMLTSPPKKTASSKNSLSKKNISKRKITSKISQNKNTELKRQCECKTAKGERCKLDASNEPKDDPRFCKRFHRKCKNVYSLKKSKFSSRQKNDNKNFKNKSPKISEISKMSKKELELNMCSGMVPKPIRYMIANMLSYSDLNNLCLTNKKCLELCKDDNYWKNRIMSKLGMVPESAKKGEFKKWYVENVNDVYYTQKDKRIHALLNLVKDEPTLLLENVKSVNMELWNSYGYFAIDSFGNLNYYGDFDVQIATNVKTFVADRPLPIDPNDDDDYYESGIYYIDKNDDLYMILFHGDNKKVDVLVKLAENISFAHIFEGNEEENPFGVLHYISENVLYEIDMRNYGVDPSSTVNGIKKLIHFTNKEDERTLIFIDTNNDLKIGEKYDTETVPILIKGVKNAYIKEKVEETSKSEDFRFELYYIDMDNKLYKISNIEEYIGTDVDKQETIELKSELIFENVKDYGYFPDYMNNGKFASEHILTKNGDLYQRVGENPFTLVQKNVNKLFDNYYYSMLLFSVVV